MTTHTAAALPAYSRTQRVTQARVMKSEWTKLRTAPAALWSLLSAVILAVSLPAALIAFTVAAMRSPYPARRLLVPRTGARGRPVSVRC